MIFVFYFFAVVLILLSFKSFRGGLEYLRYFKAELAKSRSKFTPFVTVIAPYRGLDAGSEENLLSLFEQDYPDFEIIFVVDDKDDPAVAMIEKVSGKVDFDKKKSSLIVAGKADGCSQKVENLREAILHAADDSVAFVCVDSDTRTSHEWLRSLVASLENENIGATTGYRWFISENPTLASELRSTWNASIASALGPNTKSNFCWGGSMAIRRDTFERLKIREKWAGTLSDDFAVTRAMNEANLPIVFIPQALTASTGDCTFNEMLEFTTRQIKITSVYAPKLWVLIFVGSAHFNAVMITSLLIAVMSAPYSFAFVVALATLFLVAAFSLGKSWLRLRAVSLVLAGHEKDLKKQMWTHNTLWLISPAIFLYNSIYSLASRRLRWRGTIYELKSPTETVIIAD